MNQKLSFWFNFESNKSHETFKSLYTNNPFFGMDIAFILIYNYKFSLREDALYKKRWGKESIDRVRYIMIYTSKAVALLVVAVC